MASSTPGAQLTVFASLQNQTAVVTGSSSGIGRAIVMEFARAGADVAIHCRSSESAAESVAAEIQEMGRCVEVVTADLGTDAGRTAFSDAVTQAVGVPDIWVNNAGADLLTGAATELSYSEKLQRLLDIDVSATIALSRTVGRLMHKRGSGVILNIGWDQAATGMDGDSGELFAAAKNAIMGFTRSLTLSLAPNVRVNCIAPGWIRTAWGESASEQWQQRVLRETPLGRWGEPDDIARLARFLVSEDASYITGQVINANGGAVR